MRGQGVGGGIWRRRLPSSAARRNPEAISPAAASADAAAVESSAAAAADATAAVAEAQRERGAADGATTMVDEATTMVDEADGQDTGGHGGGGRPRHGGHAEK
jgi:hypothetical protein